MNNITEVKADSLAAAMARAFGAIEGATKVAAGQVGQQKYKYADLSAVIEAIKPALIANNLFFTQHPEPAQGGVQIETVLHHAGGEHLSLGSLFVPAKQNDAQAYGSALTYARRYALVTAFGVPVDDDDGNAATKSPPAQAAAPKLVNDGQWTELVTLIEATKTDAGRFCAAFGIDSVKALPADAFARAKQQLSRKLAQVEPVAAKETV